MTKKATKPDGPELDLSDVDHRVGQLVGGGQLWDPCSSSDIRRWVMAMDYPNPLHWDEQFARDSKFGGIVAPQSIAVALDYGHGAAPACVGTYSQQPPDLRRRGVVVLRLPGTAGRQAVPGASLPRLQGHRDEIRRADHVLARRHRAHQPARHAGGQRAVDRDPLPRRRSHQARHVRKPARRNQALDPNRAGRDRAGCATTG